MHEAFALPLRLRAQIINWVRLEIFEVHDWPTEMKKIAPQITKSNTRASILRTDMNRFIANQPEPELARVGIVTGQALAAETPVVTAHAP